MKFIFSRPSWGIIIVVIGILAILGNFGIDIHFWEFFWPLLFIFFGLRMIIKPSKKSCCSADVIMNEGHFQASKNQKDYSVLFGQGEFDFTNIEPSKDDEYEVDVIFGSGKLKIKKGTAVRIITSTAFGTVTSAVGKNSGFGERIFETKASENEKILNIKASAVFGSLNIVEV